VWCYISGLIKEGIKQFVPVIAKISPNDSTHLLDIILIVSVRLDINVTEIPLNRTNSNLKTMKLYSKLHEISNAKSNYESSLISSLSSNNCKIYKYIRSLRKSNSIPSSVYCDSTSPTSDSDKASLFNKFFYSVFTKTSSHLAPPGNIDDSSILLELDISNSEVLEVLLKLDTTKAMGPDEIPSVVLQKCATVLYQPLCYLFNLTLQFSYFPREWRIHKIVPIFKSTFVRNYRPISLLSNTSKVLERIIYNKIVNHISTFISLDLCTIGLLLNNYFYFYTKPFPFMTNLMPFT